MKESLSNFDLRSEERKEAVNYLSWYRQAANQVLEEIWSKKKSEVAKISPLIVEMFKIHEDLSYFGKKMRGALVQLGYESAGGRESQAILRASVAIEILHNSFLIHDDIMDKTDLRRGEPTVHRQYTTFGREKLVKKNADHYGMAMAINLGDLGAATAYEVLTETNFPQEYVLTAIGRLNQIIKKTTFGEALDLSYNFSLGNLKPKDILRIHLFKTAEYSVVGPLQLGAILAGASKDRLAILAKYGLPLGLAFQIKDDILGMFADENTLGKPVDSDVKEGKNTLLILKALEWGSFTQKEFLEYTYGNPDVTKEELEKVREIIKSTGSLAYSEKMMKELVAAAKRKVPDITPDLRLQNVFLGLADFIIERES
jgi:geranylgeranyl diphosphate synthase type I